MIGSISLLPARTLLAIAKIGLKSQCGKSRNVQISKPAEMQLPVAHAYVNA